MGDTTAEARARMAWTTIKGVLEHRDAPRFEGGVKPPFADPLTIITRAIQEGETAVYQERARVLALAAKLAVASGIKVGIGRHPEEETWDNEWRFIVFFDLPEGQASWHIHDTELFLFGFLPPYEGKWDGHSTEEKYARLEAFNKR